MQARIWGLLRVHAQAEDGKCGKVPKHIYFLFLKHIVGFIMFKLSCCLYLTMASKNQYLICWWGPCQSWLTAGWSSKDCCPASSHHSFRSVSLRQLKRLRVIREQRDKLVKEGTYTAPPCHTGSGDQSPWWNTRLPSLALVYSAQYIVISCTLSSLKINVLIICPILLAFFYTC